MTHELVHIIEVYKSSVERNLRTVLATIVHVEGSSYRKEGTQMLIDEEGTMTGALSGGCVEQEVWRQAVGVFESNCPRVFKYDGRYRLGCEGSIYILIEMFRPEATFLQRIDEALRSRESFSMSCSYSLEETGRASFGTTFHFNDRTFEMQDLMRDAENLVYTHHFSAQRRLCIFGTEHDAATLSQMAAFLGWEVIIIGTDQSNVTLADFPYAKKVVNESAENLDASLFCQETAIVVMSHSYSKDLRFLLELLDTKVPYIGLLGPAHRRERILNEILEQKLFVDDAFFDKLHGPVGLPIGSETPEEIALSIMAEIVQVFKKESVIQHELNCSK